MQILWSEEVEIWRDRCCPFIIDIFKILEHFNVCNVMPEPLKLIWVGNSSEIHTSSKHFFLDLLQL